MYPLFSGTTDAAGRLTGATNMGPPSSTDGFPLVGPTGAIYELNVWPGANYAAGATYYAAGKRFGNENLKQQGLTMAFALSAQIWDVRENGYGFNAPFQCDAVSPEENRPPQAQTPDSRWRYSQDSASSSSDVSVVACGRPP
jgi:hypothetical protein